MDGVKEAVDALLGIHEAIDPLEDPIRFGLFERLFAFYREVSKPDARMRMELYLAETAMVPLDKLVLATRAVLQAHKYPSLPSIAEIVALAKEASGMNRQQYHAGHYLPAPREWPPTGQRYAITRGQFEDIRKDDLPQIAAPSRPQIEAGN